MVWLPPQDLVGAEQLLHQHDARKLIASPTVDICVEARRPIQQRFGTV